MTTTSSGPNSQKTLLGVAIAVIIALLILSGFLFFNMSKKSSENQQLSANLSESEKLKAELEKQYYSALSELEEMRGSNEELNALIDSQKQELTASKTKIDGLLKNKGDLTNARAEMGKLQSQIKGYLAQINQLTAEKEQLQGDVTRISGEKEQLSGELQTERKSKEEIAAAKAATEAERDELAKTKEVLSKKVNAASVIKVKDVEATSLAIKESGKPSKKKSAKSVDQIDVCFKTTINEVAEAGKETFHIRIINPTGETLAVENLGSGVFNNDNGDGIRFTKAKETSYNRNEAQVCASWNPGQPFAAGTYKVEVYNKGYLAGTTSFKLN
jgi:myosin heavy subunit